MTAIRHPDQEPNDPTRSGSPLPPGTGAHLSQNEVEQLCLKAARGAGMSWGIAEEAGFAAAWLAMRGLDGPGALLSRLQAAGGQAWQEIRPVVAPGRFRPGDGGCLCPIALGATLCDYALLPETTIDDMPLSVGPVSHPALLLPFLSDLARSLGKTLRMDWPGGHVLIDAGGRASGDVGQLAGETRLVATLATATTAQDAPMPAVAPLFVAAETLAGLNALALRTTVPASEASRAGAGSAAGDND
ncbi:DUF3726 domain-containing protein [Albidovulum sp.]|uniref:DUF3726 domain-containing protein n=1 Tax=Albidovulum sp. TaxID=1872424 RepID=UPI00352709C2